MRDGAVEMNIREGAVAAVRRRAWPSSVDQLTGLGNRRRLRDDLRSTVASASDDFPVLLLVLTLAGFKDHDRSFGHSAGDAMLTRLGGRLRDAAAGCGTAYRIGGVEFAVLANVGRRDGDKIIQAASAALTDRSGTKPITAWHGAVFIPTETREPGEALHVAGQRRQAARTYATPLGRVHAGGPDEFVQLP